MINILYVLIPSLLGAYIASLIVIIATSQRGRIENDNKKLTKAGEPSVTVRLELPSPESTRRRWPTLLLAAWLIVTLVDTAAILLLLPLNAMLKKAGRRGFSSAQTGELVYGITRHGFRRPIAAATDREDAAEGSSSGTATGTDDAAESALTGTATDSDDAAESSPTPTATDSDGKAERTWRFAEIELSSRASVTTYKLKLRSEGTWSPFSVTQAEAQRIAKHFGKSTFEEVEGCTFEMPRDKTNPQAVFDAFMTRVK